MLALLIFLTGNDLDILTLGNFRTGDRMLSLRAFKIIVRGQELAFPLDKQANTFQGHPKTGQVTSNSSITLHAMRSSLFI
jgi:hypothetical protein